jgi:hypothetical protein
MIAGFCLATGAVCGIFALPTPLSLPRRAALLPPKPRGKLGPKRARNAPETLRRQPVDGC